MENLVHLRVFVLGTLAEYGDVYGVVLNSFSTSITRFQTKFYFAVLLPNLIVLPPRSTCLLKPFLGVYFRSHWAEHMGSTGAHEICVSTGGQWRCIRSIYPNSDRWFSKRFNGVFILLDDFKIKTGKTQTQKGELLVSGFKYNDTMKIYGIEKTQKTTKYAHYLYYIMFHKGLLCDSE